MTIKKISDLNSKNVERLENNYRKFDYLNGDHPWKTVLPSGCVSYPVRMLNKGKVPYFNFALAKEMGLIPPSHANTLTPELEQKILDTFSLQIINEYDELNLRRLDPKSIKQNQYMATRYLQLQHPSKKGETSGDGRCIWNGTIKHNGKTWDVSSRGTGVTCLAPGAVEAQEPLQTGNVKYGYGCGQAELDELLGAAILAEAVHLQSIPTERVLTVIDLGKGLGIGVRAAHNLLRPAHFFLYLKQNRYNELLTSIDYLIDRQIQNGEWSFPRNSSDRYLEMAKKIAQSFGNFAANLDVEYIFSWLDWDGDNVLANAGIIDYGSVRQFGMRHDRYRYDDVDRFSTTLSEQKNKARYIVQVFIQIADYLSTKSKKPLRIYENHPILKHFDLQFEKARANRLLYKVGLNKEDRAFLLDKHRPIFSKFLSAYSALEKMKVKGKTYKVADGVNHPPRFNIRRALTLIPEHYLLDNSKWTDKELDNEKLFKEILSSFSGRVDSDLSTDIHKKLKQFQTQFKLLLETVLFKRNLKKLGQEDYNRAIQKLKAITDQARQLNSPDRITGNALIEIVNEIIRDYKKGMGPRELQDLVESLLLDYIKLPEANRGLYHSPYKRPHSFNVTLYTRIKKIVHQFREDI